MVAAGDVRSAATLNDGFFSQLLDVDDMPDQNWSVWLDVGSKHVGIGNPYNFCTRQSETILKLAG